MSYSYEINRYGAIRAVGVDAKADVSERIAVLEERLAILKRIGDDPYDDGAIIAFDKTFGDKTYSYAAIKANGVWYTTGPKSPKAYTWYELRVWLGTDTPIYWAKEVHEERF